MPRTTWICLFATAGWVAVAAVGCTQVDENKHWSPQADYPAWTFDAPFYYRPTEELRATETVGYGIGVYYTRRDYFFIQHPGGYQLDGVPRLAVWSSTDEGQHWSQNGYFGVEQTHFLFKAEQDGRHWVRFVGPGQGISECPPGTPQRIYVVDRQAPEVTVTVTPGPWLDEEKKIPYPYKPGQTVIVGWSVRDANLKTGSIRLGTCFARFPHNLVWSEWPEELPTSGMEPVDIPPRAAENGGIRFRVEAEDKAGNVGIGMTEVLHVAPVAGAEPATQPVRPSELVGPGARQEKPGWPQPGAMLRGGTSRVLEWMPKDAEGKEGLELQFSANDGRTWRTLADNLRYGTSVKWTVPTVTSKHCRLRIAIVVRKKDRVTHVPLVVSRWFTVDTVLRDWTDPELMK